MKSRSPLPSESRVPLADLRRAAEPLGPHHPLNVILRTIKDDSLPASEFLARAHDWLALLEDET